jgi:hypothetical protein
LTPEEQEQRAIQREQRAVLQEQMNQLQRVAEQALVKIIGTGAYGRIKQIQLQLQGPGALLSDEMKEKLNLSDEQVEQLQELINGRNRARFEEGRARMDLMRAAFPAPANADANADAGNNGGRGGRGGRGGINFRDPAIQDAMKAYMEKPEVKAKMAEFQGQQEKVDAQLMAAVHRTLGKRQDASYKKLLGAPFDLSKLRGGPGRGFGRNGAGNQADATKNAPETKAATGFDDDSPAAKPASAPTSPPKAAAPAAAKAKRKSLAAERGLDD